MYRTFVIVRHTFREAIVQPIYSLLLALGAAILIIFSMLPFFTLGEDTTMFKSVGLDIVLILILIATLFSTSKSIYEEIEDRTMLTLMSKPVAKWEVLFGKYLGIAFSALLGVFSLGVLLILCTWWRVPGDYMIRTVTIDTGELRQLLELRLMLISGLIPSLFLIWLQICVLAAISVAISTRVSLVVNLPTIILIYIAGNLTRFIPAAATTATTHTLSSILCTILPFLSVFDIRQFTVYGVMALPHTQYIADPQAVSPYHVLAYVGIATLYAIAYAVFALSAGMWSFSTRELGGAEG
jgi:ABC-type transport system involved in multi-copper enzyme maturation permease subunit